MFYAISTFAALVFVTVAGNNLLEDTDLFVSELADHAPSLLSNFSNLGIPLSHLDPFSSLFARQQRVCPDAGGPSCSETTCCASGQKCVSSMSTLIDKKSLLLRKQTQD
jgi:hypothetical protein